MTKRRLRLLSAGVLATAVLSWGAVQGIRAAEQGREKTNAVQQRQKTITDAAGRQHTRMNKISQAERRAAAARLRAKMQAAGTRKAAAGRTAPTADATFQAAGAGILGADAPMQLLLPTVPLAQLLVGLNGQLIPDYSGAVPNYANSPMPTVSIAGVPTTAGNATTADRAYATDYPVGAGQPAPVLVVLPAATLPEGTLVSFQTWNQVAPGGSPFPSAGNTFTAYVLRPLGGNQYTVVYAGGPYTIPTVAASQTEVFPAGPFPVQAGDVIGFHGQGIPLDTGGSNADVLSYPAPTAPVAGSTITLGSADYPVLSTDRTYAFAATVEIATTTVTGGIRKFIDTLPGLGTAGANNLGQYLPVAVPDTTTYPDADYYEIELGQYTEKMHSDLPPTTLRGYRQTNMGGQPFHYLGPVIVAHKGRAVRVKFTNSLPTGAAGNLFIPVDPTVMGAGPGPNATRTNSADVECKKNPDGTIPAPCYTENRATIHLHGGVTPWISDGTTHQWITPAGESTSYPKGVSVFNVPDMPEPGKPGATNPPGSGSMTFYYTNNQSARLMFYHDHAHGITRLGVYAGEAAAYLLRDAVEEDLVARGVIPGGAAEIPLVIQDKTYVDATTIRQQDPTWNWGTGPVTTTMRQGLLADGTRGQVPFAERAPVTGDLWWPHVYQPAQNPYDIGGMNAMGRWHYGPWFWPPTTGIPYGPVPNPYYDCNSLGMADATHPCTMPWQPLENPGTPNPSWGAEAFLDTPVINGTAYPSLTVEPKAYRFRILNAAHDRFWNLQFYRADPNVTTLDGRRFTEVRMVPATPNSGLPETWPMDGREGGVPDPTMVGPDWIQIGTEGGFLPMPTVVPNQPIAWNLDPTTFNFGNVSDHSLLLGPAERADVIVDFSAYAGQTLILYNDAPAAFPALDARNDYYTGAPDLTETGGVAGVHAGYGPNIRTIMQITVAGTPAPAYDLNRLMTEFRPVVNEAGETVTPGVFQRSQDPIVVGQTAYNEAYNTTFPQYYPAWGYARIQDTSLTFKTTEPNTTPVTLPMEPKAIQDEMGEAFDDYGRMSAKLGLELRDTNAQNQNFILQGYSDPPTELIKLSRVGMGTIGDPGDGTQIWKITHNGVDTHPVHFHLFHVQLINRVGWDGAIRLPDPNELGWKDTVRISPLEDTIVALRPIAPEPNTLPWSVPNSFRPLEPALPLGATFGFTGVDPNGNPVTVTNQMTNFGWEYIWHCHILSHEENDMMRAIAFAAPPEQPTNLTASSTPTGVLLNWTDGSLTANSFKVERAGALVNGNLAAPIETFVVAPPPGAPVDARPAPSYRDASAAFGTTYYYRVTALNTVGSSVPGYPTITADSVPSDIVTITTNTLALPAAPTALTAAASPTRVDLSWNYTQGAGEAAGFLVRRAVGAGAFTTLQTLNTVNPTNTFSDLTAIPGTGYTYEVVPFNAVGNGTAATVSVRTPLVAPTNLRLVTNTRVNNIGRITVAWTQTDTRNVGGFRVYRSTNGTTWTLIATVNAAVRSYTNTGTALGATYYYRVQAFNATSDPTLGFSNTLGPIVAR